MTVDVRALTTRHWMGVNVDAIKLTPGPEWAGPDAVYEEPVSAEAAAAAAAAATPAGKGGKAAPAAKAAAPAKGKAAAAPEPVAADVPKAGPGESAVVTSLYTSACRRIVRARDEWYNRCVYCLHVGVCARMYVCACLLRVRAYRRLSC